MITFTLLEFITYYIIGVIVFVVLSPLFTYFLEFFVDNKEFSISNLLIDTKSYIIFFLFSWLSVFLGIIFTLIIVVLYRKERKSKTVTISFK